MGGVKRHLEAMTDPILDAVRQTGAAVIVERETTLPHSPSNYWTGVFGCEKTNIRTLEIARAWLAAPRKEDEEKLHQLREEIATYADQSLVPPDLVIDYQDLLSGLVDEFVQTLAEWFAPYGLEVQWREGALMVTREEDR